MGVTIYIFGFLKNMSQVDPKHTTTDLQLLITKSSSAARLDVSLAIQAPVHTCVSTYNKVIIMQLIMILLQLLINDLGSLKEYGQFFF